MSLPAAGGSKQRLPTISRSLQIVTILLLLLFTAVVGQQMLRLRAGVVQDTARQMARLDMVFAEQTGRAVETVDLIMRNTIDALHPPAGETLAEVVPLGSISGALQRRITGVRQINELLVADADGRVLSSSRGGSPQTLGVLPPAGRTLLAYHAAHTVDELQISEPLRVEPLRPGMGAWTVLLSRRVNDAQGGFAGVVAAYLNLQYFEDFYKAVELNENGAILLHRRDGTVLARYPPMDGVVGRSYADLPPFADILAHGMAGTVLMDSPVDGEHRILAIRALKLFPLAVNVSVSEEGVLAPWRRQALVFLLAGLMALLVIVILLLLLAGESRKVEQVLAEYRDAKDDALSANSRLLEQMEERERTEAALRQAQRIEALGQLTGGVAHDFNNLLTVMLGNIDLLEQSGKLGENGAARLDRMRTAAERGATLTNQLLAFARRQPLQPQAIGMNGLIHGMNDLLQSAAGGNIRLNLVLPDESWPAMVDPTQMELLILNLALNARDAMPKGGVLTIEVANRQLGSPERAEDPPAGDYVMVRVGDTGTGMTPDVLARAFEPFFTTKELGLGSGLGLSQVFGMARQSGGGVQIESAVGEGTSVRVYLPRADGEASETALQARGPETVAQGFSKILLVDDDEAVRSTTGMILGTMGYTILEAESGEQALRLLAVEGEIDLLLTDVAMPGMNGPELARRVRDMRPSMPVVFFSGYADPQSVADDTIRQRIVRKPFRAMELAAQIEAALAEQRSVG
jgi:signal transduction histidine kinase